jgi:hypothetical protein
LNAGEGAAARTRGETNWSGDRRRRVLEKGERKHRGRYLKTLWEKYCFTQAVIWNCGRRGSRRVIVLAGRDQGHCTFVLSSAVNALV